MTEERIWRCLVDDLTLDLCFEMHQQVKVEGMDLDELYDVEPIERTAVTASAPATESQSLDVTCLHCKRQVHASRYAPHLEKCMVGNRRQATLPSVDHKA